MVHIAEDLIKLTTGFFLKIEVNSIISTLVFWTVICPIYRQTRTIVISSVEYKFVTPLFVRTFGLNFINVLRTAFAPVGLRQ